MWILRASFVLPAHLQLVMAASAVAYVQTACRLVLGENAGISWSIAAGAGTLGLYLLDGVRSADHEDAISQPGRAAVARGHRATVAVVAICALVLAGLCVLRLGPSAIAIILLVGLALLGSSHLLPILRRDGRWSTIKAFPLLKPTVISLAWLLGGFLVCFESASAGGGWSGARFTGFALATLPLLLLDSIWLDRRDMRADMRFTRASVSGALSRRAFMFLRVTLFCLPATALFLLPDALGFLLMLWLGAVGMVLLEPSRLRSEAAQVWLAAGWRFMGLAGVCLSTSFSWN